MATMKRKYTVWGVAESAERLQFDIEDNESKRTTRTTVAQYFFDAYKMTLRYVQCMTVQVMENLDFTEFKYFSFQAWKVMDFNCYSWKVVEILSMCGLQIIIACVEANDVSIIAIFILVQLVKLRTLCNNQGME